MSQSLAPAQATPTPIVQAYLRNTLYGANPLYQKLVRRSMIACLPYTVSMLIVVFAIYRGLCDARQGWLLCTGMLATVVAYNLALRSGWSQRFQDPSLSFAGVLAGMSWTVLVYVFGGAIHATQLLFLGMVMRLGVFSLNVRHMRLSCLYGVTTMACAILALAQLSPAQNPPEVAYFYLALLVICLPTLMAVGMQRVKLTHKLKRKKNRTGGRAHAPERDRHPRCAHRAVQPRPHD